jgi:mRNA interferase MazF
LPQAYVPEAGDIVWLEFDPQAGHEEAGHSPALVLSPAVYNRVTGLMVCCPLTAKIKNYPFEVPVGEGGGTVVLADQVKNLDWRARQTRFEQRVTAQELAQVRGKLRALIG